MPGDVSPWSLPEENLLIQQADWLAPIRSKLLRQARIARRARVLDFGAGYGSVSAELARRSGGTVVALEPQVAALRSGTFGKSARVNGIGERLPFPQDSFDLVYSQLTLLWVQHLEAAIGDIARILKPGGVCLAIEPDYAGMIEYPESIACRELWLAGLKRAGADPFVGRKLPGLLAHAGFQVQVSLFDTLFAPDRARFDFLSELPLTPEERKQLAPIQWAASTLTQPWAQIAHLPHLCIYAVLR